MKYKDATNKHSHLHREDKHITVEDLWKQWKTSEVHNWTLEDTLQWLIEFVELPQYEKNFRDNNVRGTTLPRSVATQKDLHAGASCRCRFSIRDLQEILLGLM